MSSVPDAWDDEWSNAADTPSQQPESKKLTTKQTKAQKRAQQAEFNRQLWAEAEAPSQTNYFLESRNVLPHKQEYKQPPTLLSRKGPIIQQPKRNLANSLSDLTLTPKEESSEDEDDAASAARKLAEQKAQAAKDREEKQRKYEERRLELFGPSSAAATNNARPTSRSGTSSPASLTPPGSRSSTPHGGRGGKRRGRGAAPPGGQQPRHQLSQQQQQQQLKDVYDPGYSAKPDSLYLLRRDQAASRHQTPAANSNGEIVPVREPKGPDGSGRGGAGFTATSRPNSMSAPGLRR